MTRFLITYGPKSDGTSESRDVEADSYEAGDKWVHFWQLQGDGTNLIKLSLRTDKLLLIEKEA